MVKLRVVVRVIPENQYLNATGFASTATLAGERRFLVIIRDPDQHYYVGTLAREVQERYKSLYKHDLGKIKYIKDNENDCDLDPEQLVYDLLIDEGKAAIDAADQNVTIKFVQEQGGALRAGSVIPDLTPIHYLPRSRPPVPAFPTLSSLGKRASPYFSGQSPTVGTLNGKRPRLAQSPEDDGLVRSIETDATGTGIEQNEGNDWPEVVHESQVYQHESKNPRGLVQAGNARNFHSSGVPGQPRPGSRSRQTSEYYSPAIDQNQSGAEQESARMQLSISGHQRGETSRSNRYPLQEHLSSSRAPITPPSDGSRDRYLTGSNVLSMKPISSRARALSTSSKRFKSHQRVEQESDIEDTQMSPRSKSRQRFKTPNGVLSKPLIESEHLVEREISKRSRSSGLRQTAFSDAQADEHDSDEKSGGDEVVARDNAGLHSSSPAYESGNVPGLLFTAKAVEEVLSDVEIDDKNNGSKESSVTTDTDVDSDKENQNRARTIPTPSWAESGFSVVQNVSTDIPEKSVTINQRPGLSESTTARSKMVQETSTTAASKSLTNDLAEAAQTPSKASAKRARKKKKSAAGDLSSLNDSQSMQPDALPPTSKAVASAESVVKRLNKANNPISKLQVPNAIASSSRDTSVSDSSAEQLAKDLSQSTRKLPTAKDPELVREKAKLQKKLQKNQDVTNKGKSEGKDTVSTLAEGSISQSGPKGKAKMARKKPNPPKTAIAQKPTKNSLETVPKDILTNEKSTDTIVFDVDEVLPSPPRGSMGLGITDSPKREKVLSLELSSGPSVKLEMSKAEPKPKPKAKKGKLAARNLTNEPDGEELMSMNSHSAVVIQAGSLNEAGPVIMTGTKTDQSLSSKGAESSSILRAPVIPLGMTRDEYVAAIEGKKINPVFVSQKKGKLPESRKIPEKETEHEVAKVLHGEKAVRVKKSLKQEPESKNKRSAVGKAEKSHALSATTKNDEKLDSTSVRSKPGPRSKSLGPSGTMTTNIPKISAPSVVASRKSLPALNSYAAASKAMAEASPDYADALAKCQATVRPREKSFANSTNGSAIVEVKCSQSKAAAASLPPASATTNRSIRQLHEQIRSSSQPAAQVAKQNKQTTAKNSLAFLEAKAAEESSESESSDEETSKGKTLLANSNVPDPATRDPTPSSDDDSEDDGL